MPDNTSASPDPATPRSASPGPTLADVEACLTTVTTSADVVAACLACAWLPGPVSKPPAREAITRLAGALGTQLTW
jgi:arginase